VHDLNFEFCLDIGSRRARDRAITARRVYQGGVTMIIRVPPNSYARVTSI
jgi:hypothetical protein